MDQSVERVIEIAVNLDDASGELVGHAQQSLRDEGALDVWTTPLQMKKGRPGIGLHVLGAVGDRDRLARRVIELTGAFGVRYREWDRLVLDRRHETVDTAFGPVRLKVGSLGGAVMAVKPEFEDVRRAAEQSGVEAPEALAEAQRAAAAWRQAAGSEGGSQA
ncbi:MAG: nickel pincer cofactor biosynthesis protein LarC2 [Planctomycetota bacterium]|jgi:uncharacterized protein (DUF111 family)